MQTQIIVSFLIYFAFLFAIGIISHKKQNSSKDFIVGNRSLSFWVTAFSAHASDMSAWLFMGFPGIIFITGIPGAWVAVGLIGGMLLNWQFVAEKLRTSTEKYDSFTLSTFFEHRFKDSSGVLRVLTALMALFFLTWYIAAGLIGIGGMLESIFGINYYTGLTLAMVVAMTYTFLGGFYTVAIVDQFQALFLLFVIALVPIYVLSGIPGGADSVIAITQEKGISLSLMPDLSLSSISVAVFLVLSWGLGYFGQPHIITKFLGIKTPHEIKKAKYVGMTWQVITLIAAVGVGLVSIAYYNGVSINKELIFIEMVKNEFYPLIAGFILCGVLAASMSTMDSQILVAASVLSEDFYGHFFKKHPTDRTMLFASRAGVIIVSAISLMIAYMKSSTVYDSVQYAWDGLGCSFGPLVIMTLYFSKCNKYGAIAGILFGGIFAATWQSLNVVFADDKIPTLVAGFPLTVAVIYIVSILTRGKSEACQV